MPDVGPLYPLMYDTIVRRALEEDLGLAGDVTSDAVVPEDVVVRARLVARRPGRVAGLPVAVYALLAKDLDADAGKSAETVTLLRDGVVALDKAGNASVQSNRQTVTAR